MIKVGHRQELKVNNISSIGAYLDAGTSDTKDNILLPNNEFVDLDIKVGDSLNVLIYRDSEDRLIATLRETKVVAGRIEKLEVVDKAPIGAFLDWGLNKDILLPKDQQEIDVEIGKKYLVGLYEDKKGRLTATMKIYKFLLPSTKLKKNDITTGTVYRINKDIGVFVAIENRYFGLIPNSEAKYSEFKIGDEITVRVIRVREDGKIDLSPRQLSYLEIDEHSNIIYKYMENNNGILNLTDKSSPDSIKKILNISKKSFKKAIGNLLKNNKIIKIEKGFKIIK
ncbi:hypothetical protein EV215_0064 [Hypnocyclicus thermotrophus]|uniref:S1 motif domain-containing protein n=1 Tax=Hypnocyclicus thermotrophus TaxID=1627895 RepID=A0AA46E059_9FUSO|nr:S1-like domain-containing RNA-binding protein [Hypnocyclicus thermotrophus]TDT72276.1 hypothetical protein EV215_0064 [Hypnocyclicus thermotrophus]